MLRHKDGIKRTRQNEKRRIRNRSVISKIKSLRKKVDAATTPEGRQEAINVVSSAIGKAAKRSIIHPNKASRMLSRITRRANTAS